MVEIDESQDVVAAMARVEAALQAFTLDRSDKNRSALHAECRAASDIFEDVSVWAEKVDCNQSALAAVLERSTQALSERPDELSAQVEGYLTEVRALDAAQLKWLLINPGTPP